MNENSNTLKNICVLIVGKSGSGKTTVCNELECRGHKQIQSYTTRPKRSPIETGHIFVSDDEFDTLSNLVGFTNFCGYRYAATAQQVEDSDLYVIDPDGVEYFKSHYANYNGKKGVYVVYLHLSAWKRFFRMLKRGDKILSVCQRMWHDSKKFRKFLRDKSSCDAIINTGNLSMDDVADVVEYLMSNVFLERDSE